MISVSDRENAVQLIEEAVDAGASCKKACERLGITERTYYRWKNRKIKTDSYEDGRPTAIHPEPANKVPQETRHQIIDTCNSPEYASMPPCEIVPALADKGIYILPCPEGRKNAQSSRTQRSSKAQSPNNLQCNSTQSGVYVGYYLSEWPT